MFNSKKREYLTQIRLNLEEYTFLQKVKDDGISITKFLTSSMKNTDRYKKFHFLLNG